MKVAGSPAPRPSVPVESPKAPVAAAAAAPAPAAAKPPDQFHGVAAAAAPKPADAAGAASRAVVERYFEAFGKRDQATLTQLYAPNATFKDDMFDLKNGASILQMWKSAPPFKTFKSEITEVSGNTVKAKWVVDYEMFGKPVHNEITSVITVGADGRITSQREDWDESKWMSQALPWIPKWAQGAAYMVMRPALNLITRRPE